MTERACTDDTAARAAAAVLARFGIKEPPVEVERICALTGITVCARPFDYVAGVLIKDDVLPVILVNARDGPARRRFTIAHELGHLFLDHRRSAYAEPGGAGRLEREAGRFAACLLMPAGWVRRLWRAYAGNPENRLSILAGLFDVSLAAIKRRARELGLDFSSGRR